MKEMEEEHRLKAGEGNFSGTKGHINIRILRSGIVYVIWCYRIL